MCEIECYEPLVADATIRGDSERGGRRAMRRAATRLLTAALLLAVGALLAISGAAGSSSSNSTAFEDPSGDGKEGADVTRVRVTNQDDGQLVFEITLPNRESLIGSESIQLFIDTDRNGSTGSSGADFGIAIFARTGRVYIDKWTGSAFSRQRQSLDSSFSARSLTFRARQSELSLSGWFDFSLVTWASPYNGPGTGILGDRAPNSGHWRHSMILGAPVVTTTPRATIASADADADGVLDGSDKCVDRKAGAYDSNRNGCPGPFKTMSLTLTRPSRTYNDYTWWTPERPPVLSGAAPRARVVVDDAIRSEVGLTDSRGRHQSRLLGTSKYALGRVITFKVTKPGWIGAHWEIKILNRAPGWSTYRTLCIPAGGGSPKDCRRVDHGS